MKLVHSPDMVAHLWAHQSQSEARNGTPRDSNFYFEGATIYSYGSHFPIATHTKDKHGKPVVLFTQAGYSPTTGRHVSTARMAARHLDCLQVPTLNGSGFASVWHGRAPEDMQRAALVMLKAFDDELDRLAVKAGKGKAGGPSYRALTSQLAHRNAFAARMVKGNLSRARAMPEDLKAVAALAAKREAAKQAAQSKKLRARLASDLAQWIEEHGTPSEYLSVWREGKVVDRWHLRALADWCDSAKRHGVKVPKDMPQAFTLGGALLRIKPSAPDILQTSQGAEVPLEHAHRAYKLWARVQSMVPPEGWQRQALSTEGLVGAFKIDAIDKAGTIRAGCHTIHAQEVRALAARMGWMQGGAPRCKRTK